MTVEAGAFGDGRQVGTQASRAADEIVARLERLPFTRFHLRLASILGVGTFFDAFDSLAIASALAVIFTTLKISFVNAGFLLSSAYVGQFIGALAFGYLGERYGRKPAFVASMLIFGLLSLASALAANYQNLLVARLLQGLGLGAEVPIAGALFNEYLRGQSRGRVVLIYESLFPWGILLAPLVALICNALFGPAMGWRVLFGIGTIPAVVAVYAAFRLPESARWLADHGQLDRASALVAEAEESARAQGVSLAEPLVHLRADIKPTSFSELFSGQYLRRTVLSWVQWFTTYFVNYGYAVWLPTLYVQLGHLPASQALALTVVSGIVGVVEAYICAGLIDRIGRKALFTAGFAIAVAGALAGLVAVTVFHATGWPVLFAAGLLMSIGTSPNAIGVYVYTPELYPTRMRAWATSTGSSMNRVASFIAPTVVGALLAAQLGIQSVFLMFGAAALVGLVVMAWLGIETKQQPLEALSQ